MLFWLIALWIFPILAYLFARRRKASWLWRITGACFGAVVSPALMGLYGLYFVGPLVALIGIAAFPLAMFQSAPGYDMARAFGLIQSGTVVEGAQHLYTWSLDGLVWAPVYGTLGLVAEKLLSHLRALQQVRGAA